MNGGGGLGMGYGLVFASLQVLGEVLGFGRCGSVAWSGVVVCFWVVIGMQWRGGGVLWLLEERRSSRSLVQQQGLVPCVPVTMVAAACLFSGGHGGSDGGGFLWALC